MDATSISFNLSILGILLVLCMIEMIGISKVNSQAATPVISLRWNLDSLRSEYQFVSIGSFINNSTDIDDWKHQCTGVLISRFFVLSVAECFRENRSPTTTPGAIMAGRRRNTFRVMRIEKYIFHPLSHYTSENVTGDMSADFVLLIVKYSQTPHLAIKFPEVNEDIRYMVYSNSSNNTFISVGLGYDFQGFGSTKKLSVLTNKPSSIYRKGCENELVSYPKHYVCIQFESIQDCHSKYSSLH